MFLRSVRLRRLTKGGLFHPTTYFYKNLINHQLNYNDMAKDNRIRLPSGQGGLTRYFDEYKSKIEFSPGAVIVVSIVIMIVVIILHYIGSAWIG
jgi:preprotein translocase subunit Sec61beta